MTRSRWTGAFGASLAGAFLLSALLHAAPPGAVGVIEAVVAGDAKTVRALLKDGADVNTAQGDGMTALHWAAKKGDVEMAEMLLYAGANVRATTRLGGYTPLLMAARTGNAAMLAALIKAGADPGTPSATGTTPLMLAAASGRADAVRVLLDRGAEIDAKESSAEETALMFAAAYDRLDVMKLLIERGASFAATTRVTDLFAFSKDEEESFRRAVTGQASQQAARPGEEKTAPGAEPAEGGASKAADSTTSGVASPAERAAAAAKRESAEPARGGAEAGKNASAAGSDEKKKKPAVPGVDRQYLYNELVGTTGGMTPLLLAARQGYVDAVMLLLDAGADVNQVSAGDKTSPLLIATINGHFDLARMLLDRGADPTLASDNGVTPLYAALNCQWAPKALYPQPRAYLQQKLTHIDLMTALLDKGADPNVRLKKKVWYSGYNFDLAGVDEIGATPFWRAAYASDVEAMRLLVAHGADPGTPTLRPAGRPRTGDGARDTTKDVSGLPPVPVGGPAVTPLQAAAGVGYGEGFAANSHRYAPTGMLAAVKYLIEELGADVNARDHEGNTALHHAAARGDVEMIEYLVSRGADVTAVNREGQTTADMANGPVQRTQPFPEALALLEKLGAKNNHKCVSC